MKGNSDLQSKAQEEDFDLQKKALEEEFSLKEALSEDGDMRTAVTEELHTQPG